MNTEQMYAFLAVYETQSFSAASRQLIKSQSAVTQLIKSLETELNAPLFLRHVRPITPTQAARTFYPYAHEVMRMINEGIQAVQKKEPGKKPFILAYRVTAGNILSKYLMIIPPEKLPQIENLSIPDYTVTNHWEENKLYFIREQVIQSKNIAFVPASESLIYAKLPKGSELSRKEGISLADLCDRTVVLPDKAIATSVGTSLLDLFLTRPEIHVVRLKDTSSTDLLVLRKGYIAFCTEEFIENKPGIVNVPFTGLPPVQYGFASLTEFTPPMKDFINRFRQWLKSQAL